MKTLEESELQRENLFSESLASDICVLWDHPSTQLCVQRKNDIQVLDSGPYFLNKARQISEPDYLPTDEDVLRARSQTTGIITFKFEVKREGRGCGFEKILRYIFFLRETIRSYSYILVMVLNFNF